MRDKAKRKICVIGGGYWGKNHINTLYKMGHLGAVVDVDPNISKKFSHIKNINFFKNLEDSFQDNYDGYVVATPAETHEKILDLLIEKKKPTLVEKPLTTDAVSSQKLLAKSIEYETPVMVGHLLLFHKAFLKLKELLDNNLIGDLKYVYSNRLNFGKVRLVEDVFWSFAPHDISLMLFLIDLYPEDINVIGSKICSNNLHDSVHCHLIYKKISAHIYVNWAHPFKEHKFVIMGTKGSLVYDDIEKKIYHHKKYFEVNDSIEEYNEDCVEIKFENSMPLTDELDYFVSNLHKKTFEISSIKHGVDVIQILDKVEKELESE